MKENINELINRLADTREAINTLDTQKKELTRTKEDLESKTPLLGDIPFLGELFKSKSETTQKKELIIMLKPIVVDQDTWKTQLQDARALLKQWFPEEVENTNSEQ